ncbi:hypothetical protein DXG01_000681 [Tephrocybe rancida]|nr:hypothetical protein DXG01_000681 [Tephrocybe rancida]
MARLPLALRLNSTAKVVAITTSQRSLAGTGNSQQGPWLDNMIAAVGIIRDSGELIPFPYVKIAAGIVVQVLLRVQAVRKNVEDFKGLSHKLVDAVITVRDTVCACGSRGQTLPPEFVHRCCEFVNSLVALQSQINNLVRQHESWMYFLRSTAITNAIAQYKEQVNDMRSNFTLDVVDFTDFVKFRFRKHSGREEVKKGAFVLSLMEVDGSHKTLGPSPETWLSLVKPGVTITMDILVSGLRDDDTSRRCPSCRYFCVGTLEDHVQCPQCATSFHIARATVDHVGVEEDARNNPAAMPPSRKTGPPEPDDNFPQDINKSSFRYFRRFWVILEAIKNTTADTNVANSPLVPNMI